MTLSECSEYYKKRLYHYLYVKIYSKWSVIHSIHLFICFYVYIFHFRLEMYQFKHSTPIQCKQSSLPILEDENIYSQSLGWDLANETLLIKLFIILSDLYIHTSQLSNSVPRQRWRHQLEHFSMTLSVIPLLYISTNTVLFFKYIDKETFFKSFMLSVNKNMIGIPINSKKALNIQYLKINNDSMHVITAIYDESCLE